MTNDELLHKWVNNTISEQELQLFKTRPEYDSLVNLYKHTEDLSAPSIDTEDMLQSILATDNKEALVEKKSTKISLWPKIAIAASMVLVAAFFLLNNSTTTYTNTSSEQLAETLPGGSKVILHPNSKIDFDQAKWTDKRKINLQGTAFFDITKGKSCTVHSSKGIVEVLGTQFLVDNKTDSFEVTCSEGKVKVTAKSSIANATLIENESFVIYDNGKSILRQQKLTKVKNIDLEKVLKEIELVFGVSIKNEGVDLTQSLTTGFQHNNLENAIKTVSMALKLDYEIEGNLITIKNR